jgi:hypothetical protein
MILLATAIREALKILERNPSDPTMTRINGEEQLLIFAKKGDRSQTAKAASSNGLIFVGAQFTND